MRPDFTVLITHQGKPLPGVSIEITKAGSSWFSERTATDGTVHVQNVPAGEYWLNTEKLGISAGGECFHVSDRTTSKAKRTFSYEWGDRATATSRIAGRLIDSQAGTGGTAIWNLIHRVDVSIAGANLKLQDPINGAVYATISDKDGGFDFNSIPNGTYVLQSEGANLLIMLTPGAKRDTLILVRREAGGGSCGGTSLEFRN
jgi:hypothetical protein